MVVETLGEYEMMFGYLRDINNYAAPQEHEQIRIEMFISRPNTVQGLISGVDRIDGLVKAARRKLTYQMNKRGYRRDAPSNWKEAR